jgi:hypothetical protein
MSKETSLFANRLGFATVALLVLSSVSLAQTTVIVDGGTFEVRYTNHVLAKALVFDHALGYDTVSLLDADYWAVPGEPLLPIQMLRIALPDGMTVTAVHAAATETQELSGTYRLLPAQPPRRMSQPARDADFVPPNTVTYASSAAYPNETASFVQQTDLAGQSMAVVRVCPLHYLPAQGKLVLSTTLEIVLEGTGGNTCGDYLPRRLSPEARQSLQRQVARMVANPDDVVLHAAQPPDSPQRGVAPGDYDYVIITPSNWVSAFQPLADWKNKKGIPATIVTTTWIYDTYTGTNVAKIRAFVVDAYTNWGTTFFLLGGDTAYVPCSTRTFSSVDPGPVPNDTFYADFDADWVSEVAVGRASVNTTGTGAAGIGNFINKVLTYEKNPPLTNYATKAGFFGFDLDSSTHAEQCKISIRNSYVPPSWTVTTVYDSQTGNHQTNTIAAMNAGQNLMNHADHSASDYMGTGYVNHNWGLSPGNMDALTNGTRQGIFYSMGCDPAAFDSDNCIAEHYVRNPNGGGLAFIGNSRYGWYNPGSVNTLSMRYDQYFFRALLQDNNYKLGTAFANHKNYFVPSDDYYRYVYTELTLLGEPELPVWTDNPQTLTVTHPTSVNVGAQNTFPVQVSLAGAPVAAALVCLSKPGDVYQIASTDASGLATFVFTPATTGVLDVTVTKRNLLPYEGTADVAQPPTYTLTVNVLGSGSVTLDPPGGTYDAGSSVQLTADAGPGWRFDFWAGDLDSTANPATLVMDNNATVTASFGRRGDLNCDGVVDFDDINPFVLALSGFEPFSAAYPDCIWLHADCNGDGAVDFGDIDCFVLVLGGAN